jgi:hypothetical protein
MIPGEEVNTSNGVTGEMTPQRSLGAARIILDRTEWTQPVLYTCQNPTTLRHSVRIRGGAEISREDIITQSISKPMISMAGDQRRWR